MTIALETGLRKGELLGLTWDRVGLSRGVIRLEVTKSGDIRTSFENAVAQAKIDNFHFHDCRHHFASWFVKRHGSLQALKEILGHATLAMTMRYAHLAPDHLRSEIVKTERRAELAEVSAQASRKSLPSCGGCLGSPCSCWLAGRTRTCDLVIHGNVADGATSAARRDTRPRTARNHCTTCGGRCGPTRSRWPCGALCS